MKYTRVYADAEGESHFEDVEVAMGEAVFAPPAPPLLLSEFISTSRFRFLKSPPGWSGEEDECPGVFSAWIDILKVILDNSS